MPSSMNGTFSSMRVERMELHRDQRNGLPAVVEIHLVHVDDAPLGQDAPVFSPKAGDTHRWRLASATPLWSAVERVMSAVPSPSTGTRTCPLQRPRGVAD